MNLPAISAWLLDATLRGSILIVCLWLLRPFLRHWLGARATHLLWLAVVLQLLSPWLPSSPFSLLPTNPEGGAIAPAALESIHLSVRVDDVVRDSGSARAESIPAPVRAPLPYLLMIWAGGTGAILALSLLRAARAARVVARAREMRHSELMQVVLAELPHVPRGLRIRETAELRSPALCGILRPTILLPSGAAEHFSAEELRCVLLHEIGHFRRGDLVWHWMFLLARAVHWFNPLVWLAERSARADQEMACDEWVLSRSANLDEQTYGEALLKVTRMIGLRTLASPVHATMAESKAGLTRRIRHLAQIRSHGWYAVVCALAIASALVLVIAPSRSKAQAVETKTAVPEETPTHTPVITQAPQPIDPYKGPHIEIEPRIVELSDGGELSEADKKVLRAEEYARIIEAFGKRKGVDLVATPRVSVRSGQRATVEIIREFRFPTKVEEATDGSGISIPKEFETRNTGVTVEVEPAILPDGRIELLIAPEIVEFEGFINYRADQPARAAAADPLSALMQTDPATRVLLRPADSAPQILLQPVFNTRRLSTLIVLQPGETALVGGMTRKDTRRIEQQSVQSLLAGVNRPIDWPPKDQAVQEEFTRSLYLFVTARLVDYSKPTSVPAQKPQAAPQTTPVPVPAVEPSVAIAIPVAGKPGFVLSPHAPEAGYVDVRGFPSGKQVKCPYSGKFFAVP